MKKCFEYIGIVAFMLFSFYYTDKVTNILNSKDPIMISIEKNKDKKNIGCKEGYIASDGIVLGKNGKEVDVRESYSNMQGKNYKDELLVFKEITCKVNLESSIDGFIINASPAKNEISLFIEVLDMKYIEDIIKISKEKNVKINLLMNGKVLDKNKDYFKELYNDGYEIIYNGNNKDDFNLYLSNIKTFNNGYKTFCMSTNNNELNFCKDKKIQRLKTNYYFNNNIFNNTKLNLENGSFYIYKENKKTLNELSAIVNYIRAKHIEIKSISEIL